MVFFYFPLIYIAVPMFLYNHLCLTLTDEKHITRVHSYLYPLRVHMLECAFLFIIVFPFSLLNLLYSFLRHLRSPLFNKIFTLFTSLLILFSIPFIFLVSISLLSNIFCSRLDTRSYSYTFSFTDPLSVGSYSIWSPLLVQ